MPDSVTLRDPDGRAIAVPLGDAAGLLRRGYTQETTGEEAGRVGADVRTDIYGNAGGKVASFGLGAARTASLGLSDVAINALGEGDQAEKLKTANPFSSEAGEFAGMLAPIGPGAWAQHIGEKIAATGAGAGIVKGTLAAAAGTGTEGALRNAGAYISDVALGDRDLSAEGFVGAMGQGALWAGGAGGALSLAERSMLAMRRLLPKQELTREAIEHGESNAAQGMFDHIDDGHTLELEGTNRLREIRSMASVEDPAIAGRVNAAEEAAARPQIDNGPLSVPSTSDLEAQLREMAGQADRGAPVLAGRKQTADEIFEETRDPNADWRTAKVNQTGLLKPEPQPQLPKGFSTTAKADGDALFNANPTVRQGIPSFEEAQAQPYRDNVYVVRPSELADRQLHGIASGNAANAEARIGSVQKAWKSGKDVPALEVDIDPAGRMAVQDGNHRLLAAAKNGDAPVAVRFRPSSAEDVTSGMDAISSDVKRLTDSAPATRLESQLRGMKGRLESGEAIGQMGATAPDVETYKVSKSLENGLPPARPQLQLLPEEAAHRELAAAMGPGSEADRIVRAQDKLRESREMMQRWAGEGPPPGTQIRFDETGRRIPWTPGAPVRGADVLAETATPAVRETIAEHGKDFDVDLVHAAHAIGDHEAASAELAELLGPSRAPAASVDHAAALRQAQADQAAKLADQAAETAQAATKAAETTPVVRAPKQGEFGGYEWGQGGPDAAKPAAKAEGKLARLGKMAEHAGEVVEMLHTLGVPGIPDPGDIPIIGPIAKLFLRAKIASKIFRRGPGKVFATAETGVAAKAAETRAKTLGAVDHALGFAERALGKAQVAAAPAAILAHRLFDDGTPATKPKDLTEAFRARADEVSAATPQAISELVQRKLPASDPSVTDSVAGVVARQMMFLQSKVPKPDAIRGLLGGDPWQPSKSEMDVFARYVHGATNPGEVIERACTGGRVSPQEVEAVKAVYPKLFAEAQARLVSGLVKNPATISYARRVQLAMTFDLPLTRSMEPKYAAFLQQTYQPASSPQGGAAPTIKGDIRLGSRLATRLDKE